MVIQKAYKNSIYRDQIKYLTKTFITESSTEALLNGKSSRHVYGDINKYILISGTNKLAWFLTTL